MKLAIMQPYLFPYIGYFQLITAVDKFVIYDDVNFIKQGWINRNRIIISGKTNYITVPVTNASSFVKINSVNIANNPSNNWKSKWLKSIKQTYSKAKYFNPVFTLIESVIDQNHNLISELAINSIQSVCAYLEIPTTILKTSSIYKNEHLRAEDRVLDICQKESCREYINAIGGKELYSKETFRKKNIQLKFLQTGEISYKQTGNAFVSGLSIIDVLMHNTKQQIQQFLNEYQLL